MKMNKKGVELTFNTIIIAIICLIVLVVVIIIFTDVMGSSVKDIIGLSSCESKGSGKGHCEATSDACGEDETAFPKIGGCKDETPYCCVPK